MYGLALRLSWSRSPALRPSSRITRCLGTASGQGDRHTPEPPNQLPMRGSQAQFTWQASGFRCNPDLRQAHYAVVKKRRIKAPATATKVAIG
jgi:hypothetical protein